MGLAFGRLARSLQTTIPIDVPITFNNIQTSVVGTVVTITWNTNIFSTSGLEYGETTYYGRAILNSNDGSTTSHTVIINSADGVESGKTYNYRVAGQDVDDIWQYSANQTFNT